MDMTLEKKYIPLANYFLKADNSTITLHFTEIEKIMGQSLPNSAYLNHSWWKKTKPPAKHFQAWTAAGYTVKHVEPNRWVVFEKLDAPDSQKTDSSNDDILLIRPASHGDARFLADLQKKTESESDFLLYGKNERSLSTQVVRKQIIAWNKSGRSIIFLAILNGEHVGYLIAEGNDADRASHRVQLLVAVLAYAQGKGIATALLEKAEEWAAQQKISRLELTVLESNTPARQFFEKHGYASEGIRKNARLINNRPQNELYLAKLVTP